MNILIVQLIGILVTILRESKKNEFLCLLWYSTSTSNSNISTISNKENKMKVISKIGYYADSIEKYKRINSILDSYD